MGDLDLVLKIRSSTFKSIQRRRTEIGKSVNGLRKHGSKQIRDIVQALKDGWIAMLDSWMNATAPIAENTSPDSMKTSTVDFEEVCLVHHLTRDLLSLFDGMDDDGNLMNHWNANNCHGSGSGRKHSLTKGSVPMREQQCPNDLFAPLGNNVQQTINEETVMKKKIVVVKHINPCRGVTGSKRPAKTIPEQKVNNETECQIIRCEMSLQHKPLYPQDDVSQKRREHQSDNGSIRKKLLPPQQEKLRSIDEAALMQVKIEATKRKLQERYQEAETAKKHRTIQVVELNDIPKQGTGRNRLMKPGHSGHNRHWINARH